jgi:hypothetical protein
MLAAAGAAALVMMSEASAFADSRHRNETRDNGSWRNDGRNNGRRGNVTHEGRVTRLDRDRDGYRVRLDRNDDWFFVPQSALYNRGRNRDLRIGVNIRLSGAWDSRGYVYVSSADWLDDDRYDGRNDRRNDRYDTRDTLRGVVESVDIFRGTAVVRDQYSGRRVAVRVTPSARGRGQRGDRGLDLEDIRRGDHVTFLGDWERGYFEARRIDNVRSGRY